jgi:hypothetical protein
VFAGDERQTHHLRFWFFVGISRLVRSLFGEYRLKAK